MCEFVANDLDMEKLTKEEKENLRKRLKARKQELEKRANGLQKTFKSSSKSWSSAKCSEPFEQWWISNQGVNNFAAVLPNMRFAWTQGSGA